MAKRRVGLELVQCERIVDTGADAASVKGLQDPIAIGHSHNMQVMDTAVTVTATK